MARPVGTVALCLLLAACGLTSGEEEASRGGDRESRDAPGSGRPVTGGELTVALEAESTSWLPGEADLTTSFRNPAYAIYDPLVVTGEDGEDHPYLARSITSDAELDEWTVTLRPGVRFHDGTPLDAAVMKTIFDDFLMAPGSTTTGLLDEVEELRVDGHLTFTYVLSRPNGAFPHLLTGPLGWPFSPTAAQAPVVGDEAARFVGTGPFRVETWQPDDRLVVVRNDDYWREGLPYLDRITFRPVPDEQLRVDSLLDGLVDAMQSLRGFSIKQVLAAEDDGFVGHTHSSDDTNVAILNVLEPPLDDLRIRRALVQMYDPNELSAILGDDGLVDPSTQYFGADSPWYSERVAEARPSYDPEAARALIADYVGDRDRSDGQRVGTPPEITFTCLNDHTLLELSEHVDRAATAVGIDLTLEHVDTATLVSRLRGTPDTDPPLAGDFDAACFRVQNTGDPAATFGVAFGAPHEEAGNLSNYSTPRLVALINELRATSEFADRYAIVEEIGIIINEAAPITFVSGTPALLGVRDEVRNLTGWTTPEGAPGEGVPYGVTRWGEVWLER